MGEHDIRGADGTRIRVWRAGSAGPHVLVSPGLGTMPEAWPHLLGPDPGVRAHGWYHRGTLGSDRPADPDRIRPADHVGDALAVLDDAGVERCVVVGWSVGVAVATELAVRHPDRVAGLLLVAGPPSDVFGGMLGVLGLPLAPRRALALAVARGVRDAGPVVDAVMHRVPVNAVTAALLRHSGFLRPASRNADVVRAARRFLGHDWGWYARLALAFADEGGVDVGAVRCPVTVLTGRYDILADPRHVAAAVGPLPQARIRVLPTSHFLPLEAPDEVAAELCLLIERAAAVEAAGRWATRLPV